ncbi:BON domain-containing protein [Microbacterium sp. SL62]|uniref:BON domain-containing protein n=1 Tax=Microbacterium sp. SL62 TaxID=2995139 RepID=UPI002272B351|nr:BON domain-containing protein [Microbacterium sp. SL62]MCY1718612.1 BON domain-containing protein [Microbacterium sp. SL62]
MTIIIADVDLQAAVQDELAWTPDVDAAQIGVSSDRGTVTLSGEVDSFAERIAAKHAAFRVRGVRTVVDDLAVHPKANWPITETDIAKEVQRTLRSASDIPDTVQAEVKSHNVTLTGEVDWDFQRAAAKRAVQHLRGVYTVNSMITLKAKPSAEDTEERIKNALTRNAQLDAAKIHVNAAGTKITLTGTVKSWAEKSQAGNAAWASPHVTHVDNHIVVQAY